MAFVHGLQEMVFLLKIYAFVGLDSGPRLAFRDIEPAICILKDLSSVGRTKQLDIRLLFNRQYLDLYDILLEHVSSSDNRADGFTKSLVPTKFRPWRTLLQPHLD